MKDTEPEFQQLARFMNEFNKESDRGAALVAASMLDEQLQKILTNFFVESSESEDLLIGFNAPLGPFSSRVSAAFALGLIQENEFREINLIRKIRNEFGHGWEPVSFESGRVADFCRQLPWLGPAEIEKNSSLRNRFNFAVAIILTDLLWRAQLVTAERRVLKEWPYKIRGR